MPGILCLWHIFLRYMETLLITGGSRGIGAAVARQAIGKYKVAILYNNSEESAKALYSELSTKGEVAIFKCNVSSHESVIDAINNVKKTFGTIDKLCCSAGIAQSKLFIDLTDEDWKRMFEVNVDGVYFVTKEVVPQMLKKGKGSIVFISSIWGEEGACMESAYSSSKAAIIGLAKSLNKELAPNGIRVNVVTPGAIDTDMMKGYSEEDMKEVLNSIPLGRLGKATEVADTVLFLLESEYISGSIVSINGGGIF